MSIIVEDNIRQLRDIHLEEEESEPCPRGLLFMIVQTDVLYVLFMPITVTGV